jgi:predicted TIM-barrel enzyme
MTNRIIDAFGSSHVLLPVIHPVSRDAALASIRTCCDGGVKGVWLIDQGMSEADLLALVREVRALYPSLWIGVNLLAHQPAHALAATFSAGVSVDGLWSDNAGIDDDHRQAGGVYPWADEMLAARRTMGWEGLYFGGVAFKYQREPEDLGLAATDAVPYMDVLCTSGPGTGFAADVEKVRVLRSGLGDHAMALASGVTAQNVRSYMPFVQAFLVGTGLESRLGVIDPGKLDALMRAMREVP